MSKNGTTSIEHDWKRDRTRLKPHEAMALCDLRDPEWFAHYLANDDINYHTDQDGEMYFKESDVINFVCHAWDEEDRPNRLDELSGYCDLQVDWSRIKTIAENEVKEKLEPVLAEYGFFGEI
jgi:hypothetical protein